MLRFETVERQMQLLFKIEPKFCTFWPPKNLGQNVEWIFEVQPRTKPLIHFCQGAAVWAGRGWFWLLKRTEQQAHRNTVVRAALIINNSDDDNNYVTTLVLIALCYIFTVCYRLERFHIVGTPCCLYKWTVNVSLLLHPVNTSTAGCIYVVVIGVCLNNHKKNWLVCMWLLWSDVMMSVEKEVSNK